MDGWMDSLDSLTLNSQLFMIETCMRREESIQSVTF